MTIYQLKRFIEKQREELLEYLKPVNLGLSQASFTPTWQEKMSIPNYYDVSEMTSLEITIKLYRNT